MVGELQRHRRGLHTGARAVADLRGHRGRLAGHQGSGAAIALQGADGRVMTHQHGDGRAGRALVRAVAGHRDHVCRAVRHRRERNACGEAGGIARGGRSLRGGEHGTCARAHLEHQLGDAARSVRHRDRRQRRADDRRGDGGESHVGLPRRVAGKRPRVAGLRRAAGGEVDPGGNRADVLVRLENVGGGAAAVRRAVPQVGAAAGGGKSQHDEEGCAHGQKAKVKTAAVANSTPEAMNSALAVCALEFPDSSEVRSAGRYAPPLELKADSAWLMSDLLFSPKYAPAAAVATAAPAVTYAAVFVHFRSCCGGALAATAATGTAGRGARSAAESSRGSPSTTRAYSVGVSAWSTGSVWPETLVPERRLSAWRPTGSLRFSPLASFWPSMSTSTPSAVSTDAWPVQPAGTSSRHISASPAAVTSVSSLPACWPTSATCFFASTSMMRSRSVPDA